MKAMYFWVDGVLAATIAIIGFIMNTITIYILRTKDDMKQMTNSLLSALLIINNIYLVSKLINILIYDFEYNNLSVIYPYFVYPIDKTSLTAAVFCIVALAHQVYVITLNPTEFQQISKCMESRRKRTRYYMLPVIIFAVIINLPRWFSRYLVHEGNTYKIRNTSLKSSFHYVVFYENCVLNIFTVFAPITLLIFFNWSVYNFFQEKRREIVAECSEMQQFSQALSENAKRPKNKIKMKNNTSILIIIIFLFILCHLPRCLLKFYDGFYTSFGTLIMGTVERIFLITHASITPFIYIWKNKVFRKHLLEIWKTIALCRREGI